MGRRRVVIVPVSGLLLADMLLGSLGYRLEGDLPADAQFVGMTHDPYSNTINLFFGHETFPECEDGQIPMLRQVSLTRIGD